MIFLFQNRLADDGKILKYQFRNLIQEKSCSIVCSIFKTNNKARDYEKL